MSDHKHLLGIKHKVVDSKSKAKVNRKLVSKSIDHDDRSNNYHNSIDASISNDRRSKIDDSHRKRAGASSVLEISPELSTYKKKNTSVGRSQQEELHPYDMMSGQNSKNSIDPQKLPYLNPKRQERVNLHYKTRMRNITKG